MPVQIQGFSGVAADVDGASFRALRASQRPVDVGAFGAYAKSMTSGVMAAGLAANATVFSFRWGDATRLALLEEVRIGAGSIVAFAAGVVAFDIVPARSFTVANTGGTAGTLTGNNGKMRTSMGATLLSDVRIASTAALAGGTMTLDTDGIGRVTRSVGAVAGEQVIESNTKLWEAPAGEWPLVMAQNEGFILRATVPATGTWTFSVSVKWAEVGSY